MLLIMLMAIPLIGALVVAFMEDKPTKTPFVFSLIVLLLGLFGLKSVFKAMPLTYKIPMSGPYVMTFQADALSAIFVILAVFLWFVVSIYSLNGMEYKGKAKMFQVSSLLTLFSVIGVFLAGNLLTMLLFFELMTISSYFLVIHKWDKESIRAGNFYLFFSITGGLLVALAIVMMDAATDTLPLIGSGAVTPLNMELFNWSIAIFVIGFGIKAGMVPLHIWLPHAYSKSPTPASALLAGVITKVGVYGLIRVGGFAGWGIDLGTSLTWLGYTIIILGTATMLLGVIAALIQSDAKKLLAYHSISQMGYIILGLGISFYLGSNGGFGLSGAIYHIINHSLFKSALFLGIGIIYIQTGETNLYKLGGLWRKCPMTAILMLIAVLGITGTPGFNGYASKSLLHHGISLAASGGSPWLAWIEGLFLIVGVGTAASFAKLYYLIFFGKTSELKVKNEKLPSLQLSIGIISVLMLLIGIKPEFLLNLAIVPAVKALGMGTISGTLTGFSFWNFKDIIEMIITLMLGLVVCWAGIKTGAFHWNPPVWLTIEGLGKIIIGKIALVLKMGLEFYNYLDKAIGNTIRKISQRLNLAFRKFDDSKTSNVMGIELLGISADIAILFFTALVLITLYFFTF